MKACVGQLARCRMAGRGARERRPNAGKVDEYFRPAQRSARPPRENLAREAQAGEYGTEMRDGERPRRSSENIRERKPTARGGDPDSPDESHSATWEDVRFKCQTLPLPLDDGQRMKRWVKGQLEPSLQRWRAFPPPRVPQTERERFATRGTHSCEPSNRQKPLTQELLLSRL